MKKIFLFFIICFIFLQIQFISAIHLDIAKENPSEILVVNSGQPCYFEAEITNFEKSDKFTIYNLEGLKISPNQFTLGNSEKKKFVFEILPASTLDAKGASTFNFHIKGSDNSEINLPIIIKTIKIEDVLQIGAEEINPESDFVRAYIYNREDVLFKNLSVNFKSDFFELKKQIPEIGAYKREEFLTQLDKEDFKNLNAGYYTVTAEISINDKTNILEGAMRFSEKSILKSEESNEGIILNKKIITKTNGGNVPQNAEIVIQKNIFSRIFTFFESEPSFVKKEGVNIKYVWAKNLQPGESFSVTSTTNWLIPLLIVVFILVIVLFTRRYFGEELKLRKKIKFIKSKGGEFALRVSINVEAKKSVNRVSIVDKLPQLVNIYEKFGIEQPAHVDSKDKRIEWNFDRLEAGESRLLTYIIYSKEDIIGKFALPETTAIYEDNNEKVKESVSNKVFFIAEVPNKKRA